MLKLTAVLDIDETLIHSSGSIQDEENRDFFCLGYDVYKRPHLDTFLDFIFTTCHVGFFTSAEEDYANIILANILSKEQLEQTLFVHDRKFCDIVVEDSFSIYNHGGANYKVYKNLKKIFRRSGVSRKRTIAIDDKPYSFASSYSNCIPVKPFFPLRKDYNGDDELLRLIDYIKLLNKEENVRVFDHRLWRENT